MATHEEVIEIDGLVCHENMETETWSYSEGRKEDKMDLQGVCHINTTEGNLNEYLLESTVQQ